MREFSHHHAAVDTGRPDRDTATKGIPTSRVHLSQAQNRKAARERLTALLESAFTPPKRRKPTKPRKRKRLDRVASKRLRSAVKSARRSGPSDD